MTVYLQLLQGETSLFHWQCSKYLTFRFECLSSTTARGSFTFPLTVLQICNVPLWWLSIHNYCKGKLHFSTNSAPNTQRFALNDYTTTARGSFTLALTVLQIFPTFRCFLFQMNPARVQTGLALDVGILERWGMDHERENEIFKYSIKGENEELYHEVP